LIFFLILKNDIWQGYYGDILSKLTFFKGFNSFGGKNANLNSLGGQNASLNSLGGHPEKW
jgi:hypothetical protein